VGVPYLQAEGAPVSAAPPRIAPATFAQEVFVGDETKGDFGTTDRTLQHKSIIALGGSRQKWASTVAEKEKRKGGGIN
jgi:hypothetical protein